MKDGRIVNEEVKNSDVDVKNKVRDCQIYAKNLMMSLSDLAAISDLDDEQRREIKAARDYAMQCVGRLSLIK